MLTPTHAKKSFVANRTFVGRKDAQDLFSAAIAKDDTNETYELLMWHGVGGQGKSALLREFAQMSERYNETEITKKTGKKLICAKIDFDDERLKRIDKALYSIRLQLAQRSGFTFHTFDTAFIAYYKKTRPGIDIAAAFPELFKGEKEGMMDLIDVLDGPLSAAAELSAAALLPGANLIYKWGARLTGRLAKWWKSRGNEMLKGIEQLQPDQLLERLPSYLGIDICDNIDNKPKLRPVIMLDTYEALWRDRGQKGGLADRRADAWVRLLVQDAPGVLFVFAGRDKLRWGEIDDAWNSVIHAHPLGNLSDNDAKQFLSNVPIVEEEVRDVIVASSEGLPFYLDLQVSQYEALRERGENPVADQFGGAPSGILARFLEHLSDADQGVLHLASYLQVITRPVMDDLAEAFPGRSISYSFEKMISRSSFVEISDGAYEIHALMKAELQRIEEAENKKQFVNIHSHLFHWYDNKIDAPAFANPGQRADKIALILMAIKHLRICNSAGLADWFFGYRVWLEDNSEWEVLEECCRFMLDSSRVAGKLGIVEETTIENNLSCVLDAQGRSKDARLMFKKAISKLPYIGEIDENFVVAIRFNAAKNLYSLGRYLEAANALELASKSLSAKSMLSEFLQIELERARGKIYLKTGNYTEAEHCFRKLAKRLLSQSGLSSEQLAFALSDLAQAIRTQQRFAEAEGLMRFAFAIYAKLAFNDLDVETNKSDLNKCEGFFTNLDVTQFPTNAVPILRKNWFDIMPLMLNAAYRNKVHDLRKWVSYEAERTSLVRFLTASNLAQVAIDEHDKSDEFVTQFEKFLEESDHGKEMKVLLAKGMVQLRFFAGARFECYYDHTSKCIATSLPQSQKNLNALSLIFMFGELYHAACNHGGFVPPAEILGAVALSEYHHSLNLAILIQFSEAFENWSEQRKADVLKLLNSEMIEFVACVRRGKSREELYDQYCNIHDSALF